MAEYIDREAVINRIKEYASDVYGVDLDDPLQFAGNSKAENFCEGLYEATELVDDITAADVAPVVHGGGTTTKTICSAQNAGCSGTTATMTRKTLGTAPTAARRWMVWNENLQKSVGDARKLLCENWCCKVGTDGGGEIQRLFYRFLGR